MAIRLAIDSGVSYPRPFGGFGGWLKTEGGSRITVARTVNNVFDLGVFASGVWEASIIWLRAGIGIKAMAPGDKPPLATQAELAAAAADIASATLANWQAGTARHVRLTLADAFTGRAAPETLWMTVSVAGAGGTFICCAAGRVTLVD